MRADHTSLSARAEWSKRNTVDSAAKAMPALHFKRSSCRITLLDKDDNVIVQLGDDEAWRKVALAEFKMRGQRPKWQTGRFIHPHDACFDKDGNIFVVEWVSTGRVTKLRKP